MTEQERIEKLEREVKMLKTNSFTHWQQIVKLTADIDELRRYLALQPVTLLPEKGMIVLRDGRLYLEASE